MFRYVGLVWDHSKPTAQAGAMRLLHQLTHESTEWHTAVTGPGIHVAYKRGHSKGALTVTPLARGLGVVLGTVFQRCPGGEEAGSSRHRTFSSEETDQIVATRGRALVDLYWGRYIAFITTNARNPATTWLVKDPTGRLPCFVAQHGEVHVVFSYMPDCVALGFMPFNINWNFVAARVALGQGRPDETGIENITEVCGGECVEFTHGHQTRQLYWNPRSLFARAAFDEPVSAAQSLRRTVKSCVHAWAASHDTIVHRLSGGLDSSIVLSCLADAPSRPRIVCLTYFRAGGASDERPWARLAARHCDCAHVEHARDPRINFSALPELRAFASPPLTTSFLETDDIERELTDRHNASAICTGDGGDSLFGSTAARFSVLDYLRRRGVRPALLRLASDVALLNNQSVWSVLSKTVRQSLCRPDSGDIVHLREARKLARPELREPILAMRDSFAHCWFQAGRMPPGANEMLSLLTMPDLFYPPLSDLNPDLAESVSPLLSLPIVERCASIPTYLHFDAGRDRGLARRAFAGDVPAPILARHWKDRVQGFPEEMLRANRGYFREILLDGLLVKERFLDRQAVEATLAGTHVKDSASVGEILDHVLVEAWLRSWARRISLQAAA